MEEKKNTRDGKIHQQYATVHNGTDYNFWRHIFFWNRSFFSGGKSFSNKQKKIGWKKVERTANWYVYLMEYLFDRKKMKFNFIIFK